MVHDMELILILLLVASVLYFAKGMRTSHTEPEYLATPGPPKKPAPQPQLKEDLLHLAELLFTPADAQELKSQLDLHEADHAAFIEQYQSLYDFVETDTFARASIELIFIYYAQGLRNYLCAIDWTGESEQDQLRNFIQAKLDQVGFKHFDWRFLQDFELRPEAEKLAHGDDTIHKMIAIDQQLQTIHYQLVTIDVDWDTYLLFIVHQQDFAGIAQIQYPHFQIVAVSDWWANPAQ